MRSTFRVRGGEGDFEDRMRPKTAMLCVDAFRTLLATDSDLVPKYREYQSQDVKALLIDLSSLT